MHISRQGEKIAKQVCKYAGLQVAGKRKVRNLTCYLHTCYLHTFLLCALGALA